MERIATDERLQEIRSNGLGFVYNDFSGHGATASQYNVLHAARCRWLGRSSSSVPKLWFDSKREALAWLQQERGAEGTSWRRCQTCSAVGARASRIVLVAPAHAPIAPVPTDRVKGWVVDSAPLRVEAWSDTRLPFAPKGRLGELRAALVRALRSLQGSPGQQLHAVYTSTAAQHADLENVLVYNVGASAFAALAARELSLERVIDDPPASAPRLAHHQVYEQRIVGDPWDHWAALQTVASFGPTSIPRPAAETKPAAIWHAIRQGEISALRMLDSKAPIGLEIRLQCPPDASPDLAAIVKPLIDAVVAAFHIHDESSLDGELLARLATQLGVAGTEIRHLLLKNDHAVLGRRSLVTAWRAGVKWNPADDRLFAIRFIADVVDEPRSAGWRLSGRLVEIRLS